MATEHAHHHHNHAAGLSEDRLKLSFFLSSGFVVLEALAGLRSHSLALLSDAGHNFTDALALALAWYAIRLARKPASPTKTYGYHRAGILSALFNAVTLLVIAVFILEEAYQIFRHPQHVESNLMIGTALVAVLMNTVIALWLQRDAAHDVNMRGAFIHMAGDAISSAGVVVAGIVIHFTGWPYIDPLISVVIGLFIAWSSWGIVRETVNILLEGTPRGLDVPAMSQAMLSVPGVIDIHDLHVWTITDGMNALSCHLRVGEKDVRGVGTVVRSVKQLLASDYEITHATIETECIGCESPELYCQMPAHKHSCSHDH